ncbi:CAP domain-containing protein [Candidatus Uhrbacteria bacterium]|nr:CAP domain-containing protein [Candidatus Uhrbacteria bacterium]
MKQLFVGICLLSLLWSFPPATRAAVTNGSLIKSSENRAVYYIIDGKRYAFPNEKVFFSWYDTFGGVSTVSPVELAGFPLAGNVTYRPGRSLVKIQTDPKVYAVSRYGILRWIDSEQTATTLYGNWPSKVHDIPDAFFINYQIGQPITTTNDYSPQNELNAAEQIAQNILGASVPVITNPFESIERKAFDLINQHRTSNGLAVLTWSDTVANVSRDHSKNMADGKVPFGHDGFNDRVHTLRKHLSFSSAAENVAYNGGYDDPASTAVEGWLKSPGHLANIVGAYTQSGIGVATSTDGSYYFTQIFIQ